VIYRAIIETPSFQAGHTAIKTYAYYSMQNDVHKELLTFSSFFGVDVTKQYCLVTSSNSRRVTLRCFEQDCRSTADQFSLLKQAVTLRIAVSLFFWTEASNSSNACAFMTIR
jgi:hypothetical protein